MLGYSAILRQSMSPGMTVVEPVADWRLAAPMWRKRAIGLWRLSV
jgi:hypothetical protein